MGITETSAPEGRTFRSKSLDCPSPNFAKVLE